jgi:hypothetical protein
MNAGSDAATASARIEIRDDEGPGGETVSEPVEVTGTSAGLRSTDWVRVPDGFRAGLATVQIKSSDPSAETRVTADTLQLAYRNPVVTLAEYTAR